MNEKSNSQRAPQIRKDDKIILKGGVKVAKIILIIFIVIIFVVKILSLLVLDGLLLRIILILSILINIVFLYAVLINKQWGYRLGVLLGALSIISDKSVTNLIASGLLIFLCLFLDINISKKRNKFRKNSL